VEGYSVKIKDSYIVLGLSKIRVNMIMVVAWVRIKDSCLVIRWVAIVLGLRIPV